MKQTLRVLMLEDSAADAHLVLTALEDAGLGITAQRVDTREEYRAALDTFLPDVVLSDYSLGSFDAQGALKVLRDQRPIVPLIVVTESLETNGAATLLRSGAEDVLTKQNLQRLPASIAAGLAVRRPLEKLSPRQLEVLRLVAEGHSTPDIARHLALSIKTIETHRGELMKRLGIHDVVTLVRYAVRVGLVPTEA